VTVDQAVALARGVIHGDATARGKLEQLARWVEDNFGSRPLRVRCSGCDKQLMCGC
jgi:hypothetical protein